MTVDDSLRPCPVCGAEWVRHEGSVPTRTHDRDCILFPGETQHADPFQR
jgi:hypothetical protein